MPNPDPNAITGSTILQPPFAFGAKSYKCLLEADESVQFYDAIGQPLQVENIDYATVVKIPLSNGWL